jgi:hypothetical protein
MSKVYHEYLYGDLIGPTVSMNMSIAKNTTYSQICPDCSHNECIPERGRSNEKSKITNPLDPKISYKINNYGYRSDDFNIEDSESNFLYSGCSNTFGIGVPIESIWAHQLNSFLGGEKFISLGINSGSYKTIVYDVFNYIRNFGKPKGVFLLFPNIERQIVFLDDKDKKVNIFIQVYRNASSKISEVITEKSNMFEFYNTVKMLEDYLFELDIPFVWTTWDVSLDKNISLTKGFKNYVSLDNFDVYNRTQNSAKPEKLDNDYWDVARDSSHFGSKYHFYYASILYEGWKAKYEKNNKQN